MHRLFKIFSRCEGASAVEFAIILPVLMLLLLGGMDLAHVYYMQHLTTNASREGARYAAKYRGTGPPSSTNIADYIQLPAGLNYNSLNLENLVVSESYSASNKIITVIVTADKHWWILGSILGLTDPKTVKGKTAMSMEY